MPPLSYQCLNEKAKISKWFAAVELKRGIEAWRTRVYLRWSWSRPRCSSLWRGQWAGCRPREALLLQHPGKASASPVCPEQDKRPTSAANHVTSQCSESHLTCTSCSFWSSELKSSVRSASASESLLTPQRKVGGSCRRRALCSSAAVAFFSHTSVHSESETHQPHAHSQR